MNRTLIIEHFLFGVITEIAIEANDRDALSHTAQATFESYCDENDLARGDHAWRFDY